MTLVAGCDVGSLTSKAVVMQGNRILGQAIVKSRIRPEASSTQAMTQALENAGTKMKDISCCVATGYGREKIPFAQKKVSEISCHGLGARWLVPTAKTIIDIGGQDCKAMLIDNLGQVLKFHTNDKCAAGTGRFLEVMTKVMGISLDELGPLSAKAKNPITLSSTCTVWAQADVIKCINSGFELADIGAGINLAMAKRIATLANSVEVKKDVAMTGGVAKNIGVVKTLGKLLGVRIKIPKKADPQLAGAIGAALYARQQL